MAIDYSQMKWADLLAQAQADHQKQWTEKDSFDYLSGGITNIGGQSGQILLRDGTMNPQQYVRPGEAASDYNPWDGLNINLKDPNGPDGYMTRLSQGDNGGVKVDHYLQQDTGLGAWAPFAMVLPAFGAAMSAAGGAAAAGAGAGGAAGGTAATSYADFLSSIGIAPESISPFVPASAADFASMGIGDLVGSGAGAAAGGGAGGGGTAASGAGEIAVDGVNQLANEAAKLTAQNAAAPGSLLNTALPTIDTTAWTLKDVIDVAKGVNTAKGLIDQVTGKGSNNVGTQTATSQTSLDPRMDELLYGKEGGPAGLLSQWIAQGNKPQDANLAAYGNGMNAYLGSRGGSDFLASQAAAQRLQNSNISAPTMNAATVANTPGMQAASMQAAQVNAPGQNNLNLSPAYNDMIYGAPGANPHLTGGIQKGINQSNYAFGNYLSDSTKALQDQLSSIRGGAVVNNQMGSSRQGIAEGRALSDYSQNLTRAATQFGMNNTDAAVAAQAQAYDQDRSRQLSAMTNLSGQQYNTAFQNAGFQQQANQTNAGFQQQANQTNYQGLLAGNMQNAQFQQGANQANLQSQLSTNNLNAQSQQAGIQLSGGLLNQAYGYGTNQDAYGLSQASKTAGLLGNYTGLNRTTTESQPLYQNTAANIAGGLQAASTAYDLYKKFF